jgi:competence protein ComEA
MKHLRISILAGLLIATALIAMQTPVAFADDNLVNINSASAAQLATLKGLGDVKAQAIVEHREKNGPFKSVDDLKQVKGIGDKLLAKLRPQVTVGKVAAAAPMGAAASAPAKH